MAVFGSYNKVYTYYGTSAEKGAISPPPNLDGTPVFEETDTGLRYVWSGSAWTLTKDLAFNKVWDTATLDWVAMTQPLISTETLTVAGSMAVTNIAATDKYKLSDMDSSGDPSYYGYIDPEGAWYIMRINSALGTTRYIKGSSGYEAAWTGKAALGYDYYNTIF